MTAASTKADPDDPSLGWEPGPGSPEAFPLYRLRRGGSPLLVSMPHVGVHLPAWLGSRLSPEQEFEGADLSIHRIGATPEREVTW